MLQPPLLASPDQIQWLKPSELSEDHPRFLIKIAAEDSFTRRFEVVGGQCGGPFLSVVASLTGYPEKFARIVKGHKIRDGHLHFNFYTSPGNLKSIKIDNRLPSIDGKLIYAKAPNDIYWCAFLEKAYAGYLGDYNEVEKVSPEDAIFHLTGLKSSYSPLKHASPEGLYEKLSQAIGQESVVLLITADNKCSTVTGIRKTSSRRQMMHLETEIRANVSENGSFEERWMKFDEFQQMFQHLYISKPEKRLCKTCGQ